MRDEVENETDRAFGDTDIASVASLFADPVRATILGELADGRSMPAGELAKAARVAPSTASFHLSKLAEAGLIEVETWGRHRYYRRSGPEVTAIIESLAVIAPAKEVSSLKQSRAAREIRFARVCYDHLAGYVGVEFTRALVSGGALAETEDGYEITDEGRGTFQSIGTNLSSSRKDVRFAPRHVDWSERYHHFAGPVAKAVTGRIRELGWIERSRNSRAVKLTESGIRGFDEYFGLTLDPSNSLGKVAPH